MAKMTTGFRGAKFGHLGGGVSGGGPLSVPGHQGYRPPFRATPRMSSPALSRLVPSGSPGGPARVPNMTPLSPAPFGAAMSRGRLAAMRKLLGAFGTMGKMLDLAGSVEEVWQNFGPNSDWWQLPQKTINPTGGWTQCANPLASCLPNQSLTLWDWFGSHATNSGVCNLGACPTNSVSVLGDAIPSMAGWPSTVNLVNIGSPGSIGGRYHHLQQWRRIGPALPLWTVPRPIRPTVPIRWSERASAPGPSPRKSKMDSPAVRGTPKLDVDGRVIAKPRVRPSTDIVFPPGRPPVVKPGEHVDEPDKVPTKKVRGVPGAMVAAIKAMHGLTELGDWVDALYEALPPIARCAGKRGLVHDLICVLEHADAFADPEVMAAAIGNLIANGVEDKVIGALFGSNWRFGGSFRPDNYGGTAWVGGGYGAPTPDAGYGGLISWSGSARMSPM